MNTVIQSKIHNIYASKLTRDFLLVTQFLLISLTGSGQKAGCTNGPSVSLSSTSGITCSITPVTVSGNIFGGSATAVTIKENGSGAVSPSSSGISPFSFTYTPVSADIGKTVTITVTTNNPSGSPCKAAKASYVLTVSSSLQSPAVGTITQPTCAIATGSVILNGLPASGTWTINPGGITGTGVSKTITGLSTGTYSFTVSNSAGCTSAPSANVVINAQLPPPTAPTVGTITQPTCTVSTGSVALTGLPSSGSWMITRSPGAVTNSGSGVTATISGIPSGTYTFTVTNSSGCISVSSANVVINTQPQAPETPVVTMNCSSGSGNAIISVTVPLGAGLEYSLDAGSYQTSPVFNGVANGNHSLAVSNTQGCTITGSTFVVSCGCINPPAVSLSSNSGSTCGTIAVTVSGNTFGGSATSVKLTENGSGIVTPDSLTTSPFSFTYTPATSDIGKTVTITVATNNPSGSPCNAAVVTYTLMIHDIPSAPTIGPITNPTCILATGSVALNGLPSSGTWTLTRYPGTFTTAGTDVTTTISGLPAGTYNYTVTNQGGCTSVTSGNVIIPIQPSTPPPPVVGIITQPTIEVPTGSVSLSGLPSPGEWIITRLPDMATTSGSGTIYRVTGLSDGNYTFTLTNGSGCISETSAIAAISTPEKPILKIKDPPFVCSPLKVDLTASEITAGSTSGLIFTYWTDAGATTEYSTPYAADSGIYYIKGTTISGYFDVKPVVATVGKEPVADAGPDQILNLQFNTTLDAELGIGETGVWVVNSGTGLINSVNEPKSAVSNLSAGKNTLSWIVTKGTCPSDTGRIDIIVDDILIPTLITPNGDSYNEFFVIRGLEALGRTELIVFDRRGALVFKNSDYDNKWNGVDYNKNPLHNDTYFYRVKPASGRTYSGYIVIRR